jgi:hypothetical protein
MSALAFFWTQRGYAAEGADYGSRVLAGDPTAPPTLRARAPGCYEELAAARAGAALAGRAASGPYQRPAHRSSAMSAPPIS